MSNNFRDENNSTMGHALRDAGFKGEAQAERRTASTTEAPREERVQREVQPARSLGSFAAKSRRGLRIERGSQVTRDWLAAAETIYKEFYQQNRQSEGVQTHLLGLDEVDGQRAPISSLLVVYSFKSDQGRPTAVVAVGALAASLPNGNPRREYRPSRHDRPIQDVEFPPASLLDEHYASLVQSRVHQELGTGYDVVIAGAQVIPSNFQPNAEGHETQNVALNLASMVEDRIDRQFRGDSAQFVSTRDISNSTSQAKLSWTTHSRPTMSMVGLPQREDVVLNLTSQVKSANENSPDTIEAIATVGGYLNLNFIEPETRRDERGNEETRRFLPQFMITDQRPPLDSDIPSLELSLLGMSQVPRLANEQRFFELLMPAVTNGVEGRDAAALGYEVNYTGIPGEAPAGYVKGFHDELNQEQQYQFLKKGIFPELGVALAYDESDPYAWLNAPFNDAHDRDCVGYKAIVQAADNLVDGRFSKNWDFKQPIATHSGVILHNGYYFEGNDESKPRSLLDIDLLWLWNHFGETSPQLVMDWYDTLYNTNEDPVVNLHRRAELLKRVIRGEYRITGTVNVLDVNPEFLDTLARSVIDNKMSINTDGMVFDGAGRGRSTYRGDRRGLDYREVGQLYRRDDRDDRRDDRRGGYGGSLNRGYYRR